MPENTPDRTPLPPLLPKLGRTISKNWFKIFVTFVAAVTIVISGLRLAHELQSQQPNRDDDGNTANTEPADSEPTDGNHGTDPTQSEEPQTTTDFIDLQPIVDQWLATVKNARVGLAIYDLDANQMAASYQADKVFDIASIYKLFFAYSGYRQIEQNPALANQFYVRTRDYRAGNYTFGQCLDLIVRESYNGCAERLLGDADQVPLAQQIIDELGLNHTTLRGIASTANDLVKLLQLYWQHPDLSEASWAQITDSMLNQPPTAVEDGIIYDWRMGLPKGFKTAKVYNKVGWLRSSDDRYWKTYNDAAIVEFPEQGRHYAIVVLTNDLRSASSLGRLGTLIEAAVISS